MTLDEIREELQNADGLPARALSAAVTQASALAPEIIALIDKATSGVFLMPKQENLLFFGLHAVAAARETSVYRPLIALLRLPEWRLERLLGDRGAESMAGLLLALYDGDPDPLFEAVEDAQTDSMVRWALFMTMARLGWEGRIPRARVVDLLDRFERKGMAEPDDLSWMGWQDAIMYLAVEELEPRVRQAWQAGRMPLQNKVDKQEWQRLFRDAVAHPDDPRRFVDDGVVPIDDPVAALKWLAKPQPKSAQERRGRGKPEDPAEAIRLTRNELDWLDGFLLSDQTPGACMCLEMVDGFFTALIASHQWRDPFGFMQMVWDFDRAEGPQFESEEQDRFVTDLLMRHWSTIVTRLDAGLEHAPYIYRGAADDAGREWATGFLAGMELHQDTWTSVLEHEDGGQLVASILALIADEYDAEAEPLDADKRTGTLEALPLAVLAISEFCRLGIPISLPAAPKPRRPAWLPQEPVRVGPKIGRNEPCPCGSGRKYKKCCGAAA